MYNLNYEYYRFQVKTALFDMNEHRLEMVSKTKIRHEGLRASKSIVLILQCLFCLC